MDKASNCLDDSDELQNYHPGWNCTDGQFQCPDDLHCIKESNVCDGNYPLFSDRYKCDDGTDEANCEQWQCHPEYWKCTDNRCIPVAHVCNGRQFLENPITFNTICR